MCKFGLHSYLILPIVTTMTTGRRLNGAAVKAIREALGINASTVADAIGVSRGFYSRLEAGKRYGTIETAKAIADRLAVPMDSITYKAEDAA